MGPRSNMTFITSACICVPFNSKDIRIQSTRLKSKYRKLVTLENLQKSVSEVATKLEITSDNIYRKNYEWYLWMYYKSSNIVMVVCTNMVVSIHIAADIAKEYFIEFLNLRFTKTQYIG